MQLARERGESHIGEPMSVIIKRRRQEKIAAKAEQRNVG